VNSLSSDLRFALRGLRKSPGFAAVAILTLALAIGVNASIFSVVDAVLVRPLPFPDSSRLVRLFRIDGKSGERSGLSHVEVNALRGESGAFESLAETFPYELSIETPNGTLRSRSAHVDAELFSILRVRCTLGRVFTPEETQSHGSRIAVLSYRVWRDSFGGDPRIVGRVLNMNGLAYEVIGVLNPVLRSFPIDSTTDRLEDVDVWTPLARIRANMLRHKMGLGGFYGVVGRLRPDVSLAQADARVRIVSARLAGQFPATNDGRVIHMIDLHRAIVGDLRPVLFVLMGAVTMVLMIACANLANLLLARGSGRRKEMAIRRALGAGTAALVRQALTESILLSLIGGLGGTAIAGIGVAVLKRFGPPTMARLHEVTVDWRVLLFTLVISLLTGLAFGIVPALTGVRVDLNEVLKEEPSRGSSGHRSTFRGLLVVVEIAVALTLLCAAGLLTTSLTRLVSVEPGFRADHVLTMKVALPNSRFPNNDRAAQVRFFEELLRRLKQRPDVETAAVSASLPLQATDAIAFSIEGQPIVPEDQRPKALIEPVTPEYFSVFRIPIRRGRAIEPDDTGDHPWVAVINQTMAQRFWRNTSCIGREIQLASDSRPRTIVGVVADTAQHSLGESPTAQVYTPLDQGTWWFSYATLSLRSPRMPRSMASEVERDVRGLDPGLGVSSVATMQDVMSADIATPRFRTILLDTLALLALVLAAIGVYGVIAYAVEQRTREIGIRIALGAEPHHILRLILGESMTLTVTGLTAGVLGSLAISGALRSLLYGVGANDPLTLGLACLVVASICLIASWLPARRALRVDPAISLHYE